MRSNIVLSLLPRRAGAARVARRLLPGRRRGATAGQVIDGSRGDDAQADAGGALEPRDALHDALDRGALEHLVHEQLLRERVELLTVADDHVLCGAARLLDERLALLVADAKRG